MLHHKPSGGFLLQLSLNLKATETGGRNHKSTEKFEKNVLYNNSSCQRELTRVCQSDDYHCTTGV